MAAARLPPDGSFVYRGGRGPESRLCVLRPLSTWASWLSEKFVKSERVGYVRAMPEKDGEQAGLFVADDSGKVIERVRPGDTFEREEDVLAAERARKVVS